MRRVPVTSCECILVLDLPNIILNPALISNRNDLEKSFVVTTVNEEFVLLRPLRNIDGLSHMELRVSVIDEDDLLSYNLIQIHLIFSPETDLEGLLLYELERSGQKQLSKFLEKHWVSLYKHIEHNLSKLIIEKNIVDNYLHQQVGSKGIHCLQYILDSLSYEKSTIPSRTYFMPTGEALSITNFKEDVSRLRKR